MNNARELSAHKLMVAYPQGTAISVQRQGRRLGIAPLSTAVRTLAPRLTDLLKRALR